jgi:hypothetical protein
MPLVHVCLSVLSSSYLLINLTCIVESELEAKIDLRSPDSIHAYLTAMQGELVFKQGFLMFNRFF